MMNRVLAGLGMLGVAVGLSGMRKYVVLDEGGVIVARAEATSRDGAMMEWLRQMGPGAGDVTVTQLKRDGYTARVAREGDRGWWEE